MGRILILLRVDPRVSGSTRSENCAFMLLYHALLLEVLLQRSSCHLPWRSCRVAPLAPPDAAASACTGSCRQPDDLDSLDVLQERQRLVTALQPLLDEETFQLTWLPGQTWRELQTALRQNTYHVLHFPGHGGFDAQHAEASSHW